MKNRIQNKARNLQISKYKKYQRRFPDANHKTFLSFDYLGYSDFCDCFFVGYFKNKSVLFNAMFKTLRMHAYDIAEEMADKEMDEKYPNRLDNFISWKKGDDLNEYFNGPRENHYKDWDLQQKYLLEEDLIRENIYNNGIEAQAYIEVQPDYEFGVGLHGAFDCTVFPKKQLFEIIQFVKNTDVSEFSQPFYFGEKKRFFKMDFDNIIHSTPLVHMPFKKKLNEED